MAFATEVHATKKYRLGTRKRDVAGNEFVYLKGVTNCANGSWVVYDELGVTTLMVTTSTGQVAIARAAVDASTKYGWFQIYGSGQGLALTAFADNGTVNATATDGSVDDNSLTAAEIQVFGAWGRSAVNETTLLATFQISYPYKALQTLD